jgi:glycine betaine catabolism A
MTSPADILHMLRTRPREHSLPQAFYTDPELFRHDMAAIFHRHWICVGAEGEVRAPGQYITLSIGDSPIIVLRDQDGAVRAFHNTCRHRGSRILDAACGTAKGLVCPYHRWTYRLDGSLAWAQYMPDGFDKSQHGLIPIHVRLLSGTIYVCLADDPPDFDAYAEGMAPLLAPHGLAEAKVALEERIVVRGNWKLMMENSRECYHCAAQHRPLMKYFLDIYDFKKPEDNALISAFWRRMEGDGIPCQIAEGVDHRATRLPFTNGAVSTTADGAPAVARRLGHVPHNDVGSLRWVHYPSVFNHALGDYAVMVRMLPLTPTTTEVCTKWLVHPEAAEGVDYDLPRLREIWSVTNDEDGALVERNQAGVNSMAYRPGPYSPELEAGVIKFVEWYCDKLARHLGGGQLREVAA